MVKEVHCRCPSCGDKKTLKGESGEFDCCGERWKYQYISSSTDKKEESMICYKKSLDSGIEA